MLPDPPSPNTALALVHEGWNEVRLRRPLAAWAAWQRALRVKPGDPAATEAITILEGAEELPLAARKVYRFRSPTDLAQRARWDVAFGDRDMQDLAIAAETFAELADFDSLGGDPQARYNQALCLAWQGKNPEAIRALDQYVHIAAETDFEAAVDAWTLAEILRQGAGAEILADDFDGVGLMPWPPERGDPTSMDEPGHILPHPTPNDPETGREPIHGPRIYEWLDRPLPEPRSDLSADDLPRILATIIQQTGSGPPILRISTPDPNGRFEVEGRLARTIGEPTPALDWSYTPLPFPLLDVAAWRFRLPAGLEASARHRLTREAIERYYEDHWIHLNRLGLGPFPERAGTDQEPARGTSPLEAGCQSIEGDRVAQAKLSAVIALREQLAERPPHAPLYAGYPFDRLRRRVGLAPFDPSTVDPNDPSCMSPAELEALDPKGFDTLTRAEARRSALALRLVAIAARFADEATA
ncbi:hypothetical protein BH23PLA1_BH23PLA1_02180 [soil metagenome]